MAESPELYRNYSENFAKAKLYNANLQFKMFESLYILPDNRGFQMGDIGCGKGKWLLWLKSKGFHFLVGFDFSREDLDYLRKSASEIECYEGDAIEHLKTMPERFDRFHAKDLIEHLTKSQVLEFLRSAEKSLKAEGELWISTFNARSPFSTTTRYGDFTHESCFTTMSLVQVLRASGFKSFTIKGYHPCPKGVKGRLRSWIGKVVYTFSKFLISIRHGSSTSIDGVDLYTAKPDLWVVAKKR